MDESNLKYLRDDIKKIIEEHLRPFDYNQKDVDRIMNETDWINRSYSRPDVGRSQTIRDLCLFLKWRVAMNAQDMLKDVELGQYEKMIKLQSDCILVINLSEINIFKSFSDKQNFVENLFIRWFEKLDADRKEGISIVINRGNERHLNNVEKICQMIVDLNITYLDIAKFIYIPDDLLSFTAREKLLKSGEYTEDPTTYIRFITSSKMEEILTSVTCQEEVVAEIKNK